MALLPVNKPVRRQETAGRESGANKGGLLGALAVGGAIAGTVATGGAAAPSIPVAVGALGAGAGVGSLVGGAVQPAQAPQVTEEMIASVPTDRMAQGSQQLLDGIRAIDQFPNLAAKYSQPLTQAYLASQMELKRRSV